MNLTKQYPVLRVQTYNPFSFQQQKNQVFFSENYKPTGF